MSSTPESGAAHGRRVSALLAAMSAHDIDAAVIGPGADLRYLLGSSVASHERLTALILPTRGEPTLLVPLLERDGWPVDDLERRGITVQCWPDGADPHALAVQAIGGQPAVVAVDGQLPARQLLPLADLMPAARIRLATDRLDELRMHKDPAERESLHRIGAAIDRVHRQMSRWLRVGRTEREVAADIEAAIVAAGHVRADFVIVASGPNGASPHHEVSDRVIGPGELVVVDIGGPAPDGYCSDCTRTYATGGAVLDGEASYIYDVVRTAQQAAVDVTRPGVTAQEVDAAAREVIERAGYGEHFITRTGHGIGLEVHEEPYIVSGNGRVLRPGMAFSIEPGIYLPGRFGVRIEDIVIVTDDGVERCNNAPTELIVMEPEDADA